MIGIVLKNMFRRKLRTALATLGIVLGVTVIVSIVSVSSGLLLQSTESIGKLQGIQVIKKNSMDATLSSLPEEYMDEIEAITGVKAVAGEIWSMAPSIEDSSGEGFSISSFFTTLLGVDPSETEMITSSYSASITEGRSLEPSDRRSCVLGRGIADEYKKPVGSTIKINGEEFRVVGIYEAGSRFIDMQIIVPMDTLREITGFPVDRVSSIRVEAENPAESQRLARKIELRLDDVDAKTQQEYSEEMVDLLGMIRSVQWLMSSIAAIVGGIGVMNTMVMSVMERTREFGILKAVGWTKIDIIKNVILESALIGIIGGIIGIALGFLGSLAIRSVIMIQATVTPDLAIEAFAFALFLGIAGGVYPAYRASKLDPIEALRYEG